LKRSRISIIATHTSVCSFSRCLKFICPRRATCSSTRPAAAEYDRYLKSYRSGSTLEPAPADAPQPRPPRAPQQSSTQSAGSLPSMTPEQQIDHEKLAAEREALWARWKNGLESLQEEEKPLKKLLKRAGCGP
jgi:hypothetical protein